MGDTRARGRPRQFAEDDARRSMADMFWHKGYSSTSLDDLSASTGLKRASLYGAFGNKKAMYLGALRGFAAEMRAGLDYCFPAGGSVVEGLRRFYAAAIILYLREEQPLGCLIFTTAPAESFTEPDVAAFIQALVEEMDAAMESVFASGVRNGEFVAEIDPRPVAQMAIALLHSLALRARSGQSREALTALAEGGVTILTASILKTAPQ